MSLHSLFSEAANVPKAGAARTRLTTALNGRCASYSVPIHHFSLCGFPFFFVLAEKINSLHPVASPVVPRARLYDYNIEVVCVFPKQRVLTKNKKKKKHTGNESTTTNGDYME